MKRSFRKHISVIVTLCTVLLLLFSGSCEISEGNASLKIKLVDAPGDYQEVNIDIEEIQIKSSGLDSNFVNIEMEPLGIINLLEFTGGFEAVLADTEIPAGRLDEIRLILGDDNTLKVDDELVDLKIPSGSESGLKVKVGIDVVGGVNYSIVLDFDVAKSIVKAGNSGKYNLKPVIRTIVENDVNGSIVGLLEPITDASVAAIINSDTLNTYTNNLGEFDFNGLTPGEYMVFITPVVESGFSDTLLTNVNVLRGEKTDLGIIDLN